MLIESYVDYIAERVKGKRVLDIGCCASTEKNLLKRHNVYRSLTKEMYGVDYNKTLIEIAKKRGVPNLSVLDITNTNDVIKYIKEHGQFDTIICTDVIEHISNPGIFLDNLQRILTEDGHVHLTTPNSRSTKWFSLFVQNREKINGDHVCWYDAFTLQVLLKRHGFKTAEVIYHTKLKEETKFLKLEWKDWMAKGLYVVFEKEK